MVFNGGRAAGFGKREFYTATALLAALLALLLFAAPAWAQTLEASKDDDPDPVAEGEILTYTIEVENTAAPDENGANDATDVVVTDRLPASTAFVSADSTRGTCNPEPPEGTLGATVICRIGDLEPGQRATVTIRVEPQATGRIINTAEVDSPDDTTPPIVLTERTTVLPDIEIEKLDDPDPVSTEDLLLFTLRVQNQSDDFLSPGELAVTDTLPLDEVDFVTVESDEFDCEFTAGAIQCNSEETFDPGEIGTIEIVVEPEERGTIENTALAFAFVDGRFFEVDRSTERTEVRGDGDGDGNGNDDDDDDNNDDDDDNNDDDDGDGDNDNGDNDDDKDGIVDAEDTDDDNDGTLDAEEDLADAEADLFGDETTDGEGTDGDFDTEDEGDDGVSATADEDGAEASTPGASASAGGDPDDQAPVTDPRGDVVDDVATSGPLPNTGGASLLAYALPVAGCLLLCGALLRRMGPRR